MTGLGHVCKTAEDGGDTLALIREFNPDVITTALIMPPMNGIELERVINERMDIETFLDGMNGFESHK